MASKAKYQGSGPLKGPGLPGKPSSTRENGASSATGRMGGGKSGQPNPTGMRGKQG